MEDNIFGVNLYHNHKEHNVMKSENVLWGNESLLTCFGVVVAVIIFNTMGCCHLSSQKKECFFCSFWGWDTQSS